MSFSDGYGQWLDRSKVCYNDYASVVVMITDTCECECECGCSVAVAAGHAMYTPQRSA
jgi:hypothetical protein